MLLSGTSKAWSSALGAVRAVWNFLLMPETLEPARRRPLTGGVLAALNPFGFVRIFRLLVHVKVPVHAIFCNSGHKREGRGSEGGHSTTRVTNL